MDPHNTQATQPAAQPLMPPAAQMAQMPGTPTVAPLAPPSAAAQAAGQLPLTVPVQQPAAQPAPSARPVDTAGDIAGVAGTPAEAADGDVIEKEWVWKAKEVVAHTSGDPFARVQQMNKLRADYMKKRYNKDIKLPGS